MKRYKLLSVTAATLIGLSACGGDETADNQEAEETVWNVPKSDEEACEIMNTAYTAEQEALAAAEGAGPDDPLTIDANTAQANLKQANLDSRMKAEDPELRDQMHDLYQNPILIMEENPPGAIEEYHAKLDRAVEICDGLGF